MRDYCVSLIGCLLLWAGIAVGQEDAVVGWDPRETGEIVLNWKTVLTGLSLGLACCGLWWLFIWFLEKKRAEINWNKARFWWPTAMLVWGWVILAMFWRRESWGWVFDTVLIVFGLVNCPSLIGVAALLELSAQLPGWLRLVIGSLGMWVGCYIMVRLAEWRAWINAPIMLHLTDKERS